MAGAVEHYPQSRVLSNEYGYGHDSGESRMSSIYNGPSSSRTAAPQHSPPIYAPQSTYGGANHGSPGLGILSASQHRDAEIFHLKHENDFSGSPEGVDQRPAASEKNNNISANSMPWKSPGMASGVPSMEDRVWGGVFGVTQVPSNEEEPTPKEEQRAAKRKKSDKGGSVEPPKTISRRPSKASSTSSGKGRKPSVTARHSSEDKSSSEDENDKEDETDKRQRGRPRLETKDETAADRRRTQIRLAQRAYRQRKETTIVSLKRRVTELEQAIDGMHNSFLELHDAAVKMHVVESIPQFGRVLRTITEKFITMAKDAGKGALTLEDDDDIKPPVIQEETTSAKSSNKRKRAEEIVADEPAEKMSRSDSVPNNALTEIQQLPVEPMQPVQPAQAVQPVRPVQSVQPVLESEHAGQNPKWLHEMDLENVAAPFNAVDPTSMVENSLVRKPNINNVNSTMNYSFDNPILNRDFLPQNLFTPSVPPPMSVSEMTRHHDFKFPPLTDPVFASRLGMSCLRYGYTLLHHPNSDPIDVMRAFAYGMLFAEKEELKHRVSKMLRRKPHEPPVGLDFPVANLGGSGLHYSFKRDASGRMYKVAPGPRDLDKMTNKTPAVLRMQLAKMGFANDAWKIIPIILEAEDRGFFNPPDVEAWLMDKGVQMTPYSPTVTIPAGLIENSLVRPPSRNSNDQYSLSEEDFLNTNPNDFFNNVMANAANFATGPDGGDYGFGLNPMMGSPGSSATHHQPAPGGHSPVNNNSPGSSYGHAPYTPQQQDPYVAQMYPATKTLNVELFIKELVKRCTCLGNVPGWQQSDLELCLMLASS